MNFEKVSKRVVQMIDKTLEWILDFFASEAAQIGALGMIGTFVMAWLRMMSESGERSFKSQMIESLTCVFLGLMVFLMCYGLGFNILVAVSASLFVGHLGSIRVRILAIRMFERKL
jgi:lambda family phage holin